jgi:hypothetical protein
MFDYKHFTAELFGDGFEFKEDWISGPIKQFSAKKGETNIIYMDRPSIGYGLYRITIQKSANIWWEGDYHIMSDGEIVPYSHQIHTNLGEWKITNHSDLFREPKACTGVNT